jgi:hypothetical protein
MGDEIMEEDSSRNMVDVDQLQDKNQAELLAEFDRRRRVILLFSVYRIKIKTAI